MRPTPKHRIAIHPDTTRFLTFRRLKVRSLFRIRIQKVLRHRTVFRARKNRLCKLPPGTLNLLYRNSALQFHYPTKEFQMVQTLHTRLFKIASPQPRSLDGRSPPLRNRNDRRSAKTDVGSRIFPCRVDEKRAFPIYVIVMATSARGIVSKRKQVPFVGRVALVATHQ